MQHRERGAALLTVLLLVAVISVLAATALERLRLSTRAAGNAAATEQGRAYAAAAETLALTRINALLGQAPDRITLAGGWSGRPFGLPLPGGGLAVARVSDGGNCFNLNGLVTRPATGTYVAAEQQRAQFARLLRLLDVPAQVAEQVASGAADWIDTDDQPLPQGAEDRSYLAGTVPYRTAGTLMSDRSELRAVAGVTPELYARVRPYLCTLPQAKPAQINVNTLLPEQAPLFAMLLPDTLSVPAARALLLRRPPQGYGDVSAFWAGPAASGITGADSQSQTGTSTRWFNLAITVTLGGTAVEEYALVDATTLPPRLVNRQWGEPS
jgi:general secretion pathway protein K